MRYATLTITADDGFTSAGRTIMGEPEISHEGIQHITMLDDGTVLMLTRLHGDLEQAREILSADPDIRQCEVFGREEGYAYIHVEASEVVQQLLAIEREREVLIATPIEFLAEGTLRVTILGDDRTLQGAISDAPSAVDLRLEETGDYKPDLDEMAALLTERQREVLETAVEMGYYEIPRETTCAEIAAELSIAEGTVVEHLQKIEAKVLPTLTS
jgi:predicted DNA binding protein